MPHPITDRIAEIKKAARLLAVARVFGLVVAVALAACLIIASLDHLLRLEDTGTRVLFTLSWLVGTAVAAWYWLLPVLQSSWSDQSIAQMIERRFPPLVGKLSSSLAFLQQSDESLGSKPLMRNVIAETTTAISNINLKDAIDPRPTWQALGWTASTAVICTAMAIFHPNATSQAVGRLLLPWQENPWPRVNHLEFVDPPSKVARGGDLRLALIDASGKLPSRVDIQLWYEGQHETEADVIPMQRVDNQMVLERSNVARSFKYRASGGDDQLMKWSVLKVVEPPSVVSGETLLTPPAYTGWQQRTVAQPFGSLRVFEGTRITLSGTADRPLKNGRLTVQASGDELNFFVSVSENGLQYTVPNPLSGDQPDDRNKQWIVSESSDYSLSLVDREGTKTVDADKWIVRMLADEAPSLTLIEPGAEDLITPTAIVPIRCDVEDDLATKRVELRYLRTDQSDQGEIATVLYEGAEALPMKLMPETLPPPVEARQFAFDWSLEPLQLAPGGVLSFHVFAEDYKSQSNQTLARRLLVVSENDLLDRAGRRQSLVLARLQQRLKQQRQTKQQVDAVRMQLAEIKEIEKPTIDRLQSALLVQRQVNAALHGDDAEIMLELRRLKKMLDRSRVGEVDVRYRIENTLSSIDQLGKQHLDPAIRQSTLAQQSLQAMRDQNQIDQIPNDVSKALQNASTHQGAAIDWLEELLDEMSAWDNYRRFAQELSDLLRQQRDVKRATQQVAKETLTRNQAGLDGTQRAALRRAAARQLELARRADRTLANLSKAEQELQPTDPQAAQMVRDAMQAAREGAVSGKMRQAGRQINQNRLGFATQQQTDAEEGLEEMLDELSRRSYSPEERTERLRSVGRELQKLQKRQALLSQEFQQANNERDAQQKRRQLQRLTKRQKEVAQAATKLERQLQKLRAGKSAQQAGQATSSMENAGNAARQGDAQKAQQQSELAEAYMEQALQRLQQEEEQAKSELAKEQMIRLPQLVDALIAEQTGVVDEVERLDEIRTGNGAITSGQTASVEATAEAQRVVAQNTRLVAAQMSELPAFVFALTEIQQAMVEVADWLDALDTSAATQQRASGALDQLKLIRKMMQDDATSKKDSGGGGQGGQAVGGENSQDFDPQLAQLKLLRSLQIAINTETRQLDETQAADQGARRIIETRLQELAARQGALAKAVADTFQQTVSAKVDLPKPDDDQIPNLDALDRELDQLLQ